MKCDRCKEETVCWKTSWFNLDSICPKCQDEETSHKDFKRAKDAVYEEESKGNFNYEGIGWSNEQR